MLDRLVILCSTVILEHTDITNACYILANATHFNSPLLVESLHGYMSANMEILLENHMLDDMPPVLIKCLAEFVYKKQVEKSPEARSMLTVEAALEKHSEWLEQQDIPEPIIPLDRHAPHKASPKLSPSSPSRKLHRRPSALGSLLSSPTICAQPTSHLPPVDGVFNTDEQDLFSSFNLDRIQPLSASLDTNQTSRPAAAWKANLVPRFVVYTLE